jgi:hypothetical protein
VPYPKRGGYNFLAECWMSWADVHRGAVTLAEALRIGPDKLHYAARQPPLGQSGGRAATCAAAVELATWATT